MMKKLLGEILKAPFLFFTFLISTYCFSQEVSSLPKDDMGYKTAAQFTLEGSEFLKNNQLPQAVHAFKRALLYNSSYGKAHYGLAYSLGKMGNFKDALYQYKSAIIFSPGLISAYDQLGMLLEKNNDLNLAFSFYLQGSSLDPNFSLLSRSNAVTPEEIDIANNKQEISRLKEAFEENQLGNKTLYIYSEGPLKDTILFSRYLPLLKQKGAKVSFRAPKDATQLFKDAFEISVIRWLDLEESIIYDYKASLNELPIIFNTELKNIPLSKGYLKASPKDSLEFKEWVAKKPMRIGIAIQGTNALNHVPLSELAIFKDIPNATFYTLQSVQNKKEWLEIAKILDFSELTEDFDRLHEIAGAISNLDLVIATDNEIAALSAALGKPTWILLTTLPSWQWFLKGNTSPWYDSARLFRQSEAGSWKKPLEDVLSDLKGF